MPSNILDTFKEYIGLFNDSVADGDSATAIRIGKKIVEISNEQTARPEINDTFKQFYKANTAKVREYLADMNANTTGKRSGSADTKPISAKPKWFSTDVPKLTLRNVAGLEIVKNEFMVNILAPLSAKYAPIYRKYRGAQVGTQILLYGPPGTGKTFLVKCLAGSLGCHIAVVQTKDILANLVGDAEKNMGEVFEEAKQYDKCIIFIDEIDALAASRDDDESRHTKGVLTTMLTMMDGFAGGAKNGKHRIIIAATNRPWALDSALKRGGRFETQIYVPLPDFDARYQLVKLALGKDESVNGRVDIPLADDVTVNWLAERLDGMAGADINAVCKQIVNRPLRREIEALRDTGKVVSEYVTHADCEAVICNYINGITDEMLLRFDAYAASLGYDEYIKLIKEKTKHDIGEGKAVPDYLRRLTTKNDEVSKGGLFDLLDGLKTLQKEIDEKNKL
ncbi:MAG: ATP-binding protein [Clostridiales bacterium]|jgi:transitional endoplasmic reticulum ATPase|nr:ATP-binding protein [Clostridiales bacterium]